MGNFENSNNSLEIKEKDKFESQDSVYFKITFSNKKLRDLMYFIQQEGIVSQNSFTVQNLPERTFHLWVDKEDEEKINKWLIDNN